LSQKPQPSSIQNFFLYSVSQIPASKISLSSIFYIQLLNKAKISKLSLPLSKVKIFFYNFLIYFFPGYNGPTLILIRHTEGNPAVKNEIGIRNQQASYVCGAFTKTPWRDETRYTGTGDTVLFSLFPRFKLFPARPDGNRNFTYLNTNHGSRVGLGKNFF